ncbi:signal peptidase I [Abyssibacter profundi]|uniref:Signal peptidase I n=1 Tax=Abyssibacter profundi TaxID=2182787 RepID=A0A363UKA0_9GAMM|nr:signal peptidase I [Abyssibacter profundi]MBV60548.1 signal peptidase I [Nevskiales bacterium]PWN55859.1 signal peptidase I [Abyssibacter profundi]
MFQDDVHLDFAAILLILAIVTGVIYLLDVMFWAKSRSADAKPTSVVDISRSFFPVILIVLLLRSFVAEPFRIPSGSMIPTLHVGDFILVNKFSYGLRLPVFHTKVLPLGLPERGDVVVFRYPEDPSKDFIKRIVGLPGDEIVYHGKVLSVNGQPVDIEPVGLYQSANPRHRYATEYQETLGELEHGILVNPRSPAKDFRYTVPEGHYFAMGDNRDGSDDSRRWGPVPERNLVGKAMLIWMSWDGERNRPALSRIGTVIH